MEIKSEQSSLHIDKGIATVPSSTPLSPPESIRVRNLRYKFIILTVCTISGAVILSAMNIICRIGSIIRVQKCPTTIDSSYEGDSVFKRKITDITGNIILIPLSIIAIFTSIHRAAYGIFYPNSRAIEEFQAQEQLLCSTRALQVLSKLLPDPYTERQLEVQIKESL